MRYSFASVAAFALATTVLAAPQLRNAERDIEERALRVKTVTVTQTVWMPYPTETARPVPVDQRKGADSANEEVVVVAPTTTTTTTVAPVVQETSVVVAPVPTTSSTVVEEQPKETPVTIVEKETLPETGASPDSGLSAFEQEFVAVHNRLRAKHGAPPLTLDREMTTYAGNHVKDCVWGHSNPYKYGENIAAGYSSTTAAIEAWYNEVAYWDFDAAKTKDETKVTGHFTQVVWKAATKIGCGQQVCNGKGGAPGTYLSCNYNTGNVGGQYKANVLRG